MFAVRRRRASSRLVARVSTSDGSSSGSSTRWLRRRRRARGARQRPPGLFVAVRDPGSIESPLRRSAHGAGLPARADRDRASRSSATGCIEIDRIISRTIAYAGRQRRSWPACSSSASCSCRRSLRRSPGRRPSPWLGRRWSRTPSFQPVLRRVRRDVDRRFDRARYDADRTVGRRSPTAAPRDRRRRRDRATSRRRPPIARSRPRRCRSGSRSRDTAR